MAAASTRATRCYLSISVTFILLFVANTRAEETTVYPDNNDTISVYGSHLEKMVFTQEVPDEMKPIVSSLYDEMKNMTDDQYLQLLKKLTETAEQSLYQLKSIEKELEKNMTESQQGQRLKRTHCHSCHKKKGGYGGGGGVYIQPVPIIISVPIKQKGGGGGCGYGGCGGGHYQQPQQQQCNTCGGGGYGGGGGGGGSFSQSSSSSSSGSWGKK